ncbi:MAG: AsmA family protein [Methylocystis sp.]|nr:MAG: AsmA family protein [Methylocystis sp.]
MPTARLAALSSQLQEATGLYVAMKSRPRLAFSPRPHVVIDGIVFADHNGALVIEADQLYGVLKLLPFLTGRLDLDSLALVRPRARAVLDEKRIEAPGAAARAASAPPASAEAQKADSFRLGVLTVVDGSLRVKRAGREYLAEKITASLDWRKIGDPALLTAGFDWRGEHMQTQFWVARPGALLRGDVSVATGRLDAESLRLEAEGVAQLGANGRFAGRIAGSATSVREALQLFSISTPLPGPFGDGQFSAQATLAPKEATFKDLKIFVDGNAFDGELTLRLEDGRPNVTAALHSDFVALKPMLSDAPALLASDGQWSREPLDPPDLSGADVDLRLKADHARLGRLTVDDASVILSLRESVLDLSLVEAQAYRGRLKARASFKPSDDRLSMHATAQTSAVDARALLWDAFGRQALSGALDASLALDASGANVAEMMRALNGRASLALSEGEIAGVDFERALRRLEKRPLSSAQDIRSGSSTLDSAKLTLLLEKGVGAVEDGSARGPGFALGFEGSANLVERSLSLKAVAREADGAGKPRDKGLNISFDLTGGFDELTLAPDPQAFIRRSGAAAPLLPEPPAADKEQSPPR